MKKLLPLLIVLLAWGCSKADSASMNTEVESVSLETTSLDFVVGETPISDIYLSATAILKGGSSSGNVTWTSSDPAIATVDGNGKLTVNTTSAGTVTLMAKAGERTASCQLAVNDIFSTQSVTIDGTQWATRNLAAPGTFAVKPQDQGMLYQWARKVGWSSSNPMVASNGSTTWNETYVTLSPAGGGWPAKDDPCPTGWRIPTYAQLQALAALPSKWLLMQDANDGNQFICCKKYGSGANAVILPADYWREDSGTLVCVTTEYGGPCGKYWSRTEYMTSSGYYVNAAYGLSFLYSEDPEAWHLQNQFYFRAAALSIRCVKE